MSLRSFKDGLDGLAITGVSRRVDTINLDANVGDLPLQFCSLPATDDDFFTFSRLAINTLATVTLTVVIRPIVMGTNDENQDDLITMADNVKTALATNVSGVHIDNYSIALESITIGGTDYLAVVATVTGRDK